ncbi:MAG: hypothetical protein PHC68_17870, partial [Syntrophorhabdaceae bacterium]|nr:hypothetical protein [Syntrophorhabdaceae bacterium]
EAEEQDDTAPKKPRGRPRKEPKVVDVEESPPAEPKELKEIPNNPLPYLKRDVSPEEAEAEAQDEANEAHESQEPKKSEDGLQLAPSVIEKMKNAKTPREAFMHMERYAFQGQGHHMKKLTQEFCPEYFEKGYALYQIPESALIVMIKKVTGIKMKAVEDTPKCKAKGCKNTLTEPEAEHNDGMCHEHYVPKEDE